MIGVWEVLGATVVLFVGVIVWVRREQKRIVLEDEESDQ